MLKIRAVFFDLDDTLCDAKPAFAEAVLVAFAAIRGRHSEFTDELLTETWRAVHVPLFAEMAAGRMEMAEVRRVRFRRLLAALDVPDDNFADEVDLLLGHSQLGFLKLFEDVAVLEALRERGLHIGIITNGAGDTHPDSQRSKAEHLGLLARVESFWVSDEIGHRKPDPSAFLSALPAGVDPNEVLYVGDSLENDILGSNTAGMVNALIWRSEDPPPSSAKVPPQFVIRSLDDVISIVDSYTKEPEWDSTETFGHFDPKVNYIDRRAAYAVILRADTVAIVKGCGGKFFLPGGGALPDETAQETVLREIHEELGCDARITRWLGEAEQYFFATSDDCHYKMEAVFLMAELNKEPFCAGEEELHWLPLAEAEDTLFHGCHSWAVKMVRLGFRGTVM